MPRFATRPADIFHDARQRDAVAPAVRSHMPVAALPQYNDTHDDGVLSASAILATVQ